MWLAAPAAQRNPSDVTLYPRTRDVNSTLAWQAPKKENPQCGFNETAQGWKWSDAASKQK